MGRAGRGRERETEEETAQERKRTKKEKCPRKLGLQLPTGGNQTQQLQFWKRQRAFHLGLAGRDSLVTSGTVE